MDQKITSRRLKEIASLKRKKSRQELRETIVEGVRSVESLLRTRANVLEVIVNERFNVGEYSWLKNVESVFRVGNRQFEQLSDVQNSQGIVAVVSVGSSVIPEQLTASKIVAFDGLSDPGNAGTIIRSASWFGIEMILASVGTVDLYSPKVIRSSMGGVWDVDIVEGLDLPVTLRKLRDVGFPVHVADTAGEDVNTWHPTPTGVLVIGNEAHGVSAKVRNEATEVVSIPAQSESRSVESLNAAVSCAIILQVWHSRDVLQPS